MSLDTPLKKPDMQYKLTSLEEPTDEQLAWIMKEVGDDARAQSKREKEIVKKMIMDEFEKNKQRMKANEL